MEVKTCPACQSTEARFTGPEVPGFTTRGGEKDFIQEPYAVMECDECGLLYKTPTPKSNELAEYYAEGVDFRKWEISGYFPTERAVQARLRRLPHHSRILDFGCSSGRLLAPFVSQYECYGVDINADAMAAARAKGLKMLSPDDFEEGNVGNFDVVVMVDVLEHLETPLASLKKLVTFLTPGGVLLIVTGNGDCRPCRLNPAEFWYFRNFEHLFMFTLRHAHFLERELGVELKEWDEVSHYDTGFIQKVWQWLQHTAYWQFQRQTILARTVLPILPGIRRARRWSVAPTLTYTRDHVLAVFRKT